MTAKTFLIHLALLALLHLAAAAAALAETSLPSGLSLLAPEARGSAAPVFAPVSLLPDSPPAALLAAAPEFEKQDVLLLAAEVDEGGGSHSDRSPDKRWRWRRAIIADYLAIAVSAIGTLYVENEHGEPDARWTARNDFDEGIRDALRLESRSARYAANDAGTALMGLMLAAPILDSFATLGVRDSNWDALWQTEIINAEALTFAGTVSSLFQNLIIPRERPFVRNCQGGKCEDSPLNRSMPSGHAAFAFTGAGLVCTHHEYQSLYGNPAADRAACFTGIGVAIADGILRVVADRHYATDVIAGSAIGMFAGFILPRWLYYNRPQEGSGAADSGGSAVLKQMMVRPLVFEDGGGVNYSFVF
jgi:membrane-associated phospholipid phosphatase